jgi:DNA modification methylase
MKEIFSGLLPILKPRGQAIINVPDMWRKNERHGERVPLHVHVYQALVEAGYELRNTIIWDRTNIVNRVGIFGWPSNYITMGTTFEYLLNFWKPTSL